MIGMHCGATLLLCYAAMLRSRAVPLCCGCAAHDLMCAAAGVMELCLPKVSSLTAHFLNFFAAVN